MRLPLPNPSELDEGQKAIYRSVREVADTAFHFRFMLDGGQLIGPWNAMLHCPQFGAAACAMAIGEDACVSVHGANRLGSNSLLDIVVFGRVAAHRAAATVKPGESHPPLPQAATDRALARFDRMRRAAGKRSTGEIRLDNMLGQAEVSLASAIGRTESRGAHARGDHPRRDDESWLKHTLAFRDEAGTRLEYRPVHLNTLSNEVASVPPKERVY